MGSTIELDDTDRGLLKARLETRRADIRGLVVRTDG